MRHRKLACLLAAVGALAGAWSVVAGPAASAQGDWTNPGNGSVTLDYSSSGSHGIYICPGSAAYDACVYGGPVLYYMIDSPADFLPASPVTITAGTQAGLYGAFGSTPIPAGYYTLAWWDHSNATAVSGVDNVFLGTVPDPTPAGTAVTSLPWLQSYARPSQADSCANGWSPSWAEWANRGGGGFVCNRSLYWHQGGWWVSPDAEWISGGEAGHAWTATPTPDAH